MCGRGSNTRPVDLGKAAFGLVWELCQRMGMEVRAKELEEVGVKNVARSYADFIAACEKAVVDHTRLIDHPPRRYYKWRPAEKATREPNPKLLKFTGPPA